MKSTLVKIITIINFVILLNPSLYGTSHDRSSVPLKVLFIGSSYFGYNDLPFLFESLVTAAGETIEVYTEVTNGYLADHAERSSTEDKINEQLWDYVILQGVGRLIAYPQTYKENACYPAMETLKSKIKNNHPTTKILYCMPWAFEDGMSWLEGWTDLYEDMQIHIYDNTLKYCDQLDIEIAPVGWAWYAVLKEKNYPLHYLHQSDWNHPSLHGSYLMACVLYSSVFGDSAVGIPYFSRLMTEEGLYFQTVGTNTVMDNLELWNLSSVTSINYPKELSVDFKLNQNYPNPFNSVTVISYQLPEVSYVNLKIYDILGEEIILLVSDEQQAGSYSVKFDGNNLSSGVYFYRLEANSYIASSKIQLIK